MELSSEQLVLVRKREHEQHGDPHDDVHVAIADLARERRALKWERLANWAVGRAERTRGW